MLNSEITTTALHIGENLRNWRKLLGLRAGQVAERAGISKVTYSKKIPPCSGLISFKAPAR
jgi:hypothetical protein